MVENGILMFRTLTLLNLLEDMLKTGLVRVVTQDGERSPEMDEHLLGSVIGLKASLILRVNEEYPHGSA